MILKFSSYFLKIYPVNKYVTDLKQSCRLEREDFNRCCDIHSFQFFLCLIIFGTSECHVFVFPKNFGITFSFGCFCFFFCRLEAVPSCWMAREPSRTNWGIDSSVRERVRFLLEKRFGFMQCH